MDTNEKGRAVSLSREGASYGTSLSKGLSDLAALDGVGPVASVQAKALAEATASLAGGYDRAAAALERGDAEAWQRESDSGEKEYRRLISDVDEIQDKLLDEVRERLEDDGFDEDEVSRFETSLKERLDTQLQGMTSADRRYRSEGKWMGRLCPAESIAEVCVSLGRP